MKENKIFPKVKKALKLFEYYGIRIENSCEVGTPDSFFQGPRGAFWIENKQVKGNCEGKVSPGWEPGQIGWARRHIKHGGNWRLCIAVNDTLLMTDEPKEEYHISELELLRYHIPNTF